MQFRLFALVGLFLASFTVSAANINPNQVMVRNDAEVIGACQTAFLFTKYLTNSSVQAINAHNVAVDQKIIAQIMEVNGNMSPNVANFEKLFQQTIIPRARRLGMTDYDINKLRQDAYETQTARFKTAVAKMDKEHPEMLPTPRRALLSMPAVNKCVQWYFHQKKDIKDI